MKNVFLPAVLFVFIVMGAGCQVQPTEKQVDSLLSLIEDFQLQAIPENERQEISELTITPEPTQIGAVLYRGAWFDVQYPQNFTVKPTAPTSVYKNITQIQTDEAYFTSADGAVEFFVYSPLWSGNPESYLAISANEEIVSEKIEEVKEGEKPGQFGDSIVRWVTINAKDGSYNRSFVSIKKQVGIGSDTHHVFGYKYKDKEAYEQHKEEFLVFKNSLRQYAD